MRSTDGAWLVAVALGRDQTQPTLLHFDGRQWTPVALPWIQSVRSYGICQLAMTAADEGWAAGISISYPDEGRPHPQGGYTPTSLPVLLRCQHGVWSVAVS